MIGDELLFVFARYKYSVVVTSAEFSCYLFNCEEFLGIFPEFILESVRKNCQIKEKARDGIIKEF